MLLEQPADVLEQEVAILEFDTELDSNADNASELLVSLTVIFSFPKDLEGSLILVLLRSILDGLLNDLLN